MEVFTKLGIDSSVLIAQAFNFFLLLGLLSFLVYKPILKLLDERKERIKNAEENAKLIDEKLARTESLVEKELKRSRKEAQDIVTKAEASAKKTEEQLVAEAKEKVEKIIADGRNLIKRESEEASREIQSQVSKIVILATEKLIKREINDKDQDKFITEAMQELQIK